MAIVLSHGSIASERGEKCFFFAVFVIFWGVSWVFMVCVFAFFFSRFVFCFLRCSFGVFINIFLDSGVLISGCCFSAETEEFAFSYTSS